MIPRILSSRCCPQILVHFKCVNHYRSSSGVVSSLAQEQVKQNERRLAIVPSRDGYERNQQQGSHTSGRQIPPRNLLLGGFIASIASSLGLETEKKEEEDPLVMAIKRGILYLDNGLHEQAEKSLHEALQIAQSTSNDKAIDYIYVIMADNAMSARDLAKAESLYKETLRRILANEAKEDDESVIEISLQLATIYAERREFENADEGFAFCIQKQKQRIKDIDMNSELSEEQKNSLALYGMILDWYSKYCQLRQDFKLALQYTTEAYQLSKKVLGEVHEQTLVLMSDMGVLTEKTGNADEAIRILKKVIDLATSVASEGISTFFYNLGMCYLNKRDGDNANYCCVRAMKKADDLNGNPQLRGKARKCVSLSRDLMIEAKLGKKM